MFEDPADSPEQYVTPASLSFSISSARGNQTDVACPPAWVKYLSGPVWVSSADNRISYINDEALALLGVEIGDCIGRPCHEVIRARDESQRRFCSESCLMRRLTESHSKLKPTRLQVASASGKVHWLQFIVIPIEDPINGGASLVHYAINEDHLHAIKSYLVTITKRTPRQQSEGEPSRYFQLTKREREILKLLTEDETLWSIAHRLNVSYSTVRNHAQHILAKLGVHSIIEAVAYYLVAQDAD
jgi:DNA-binding CsgD family transcriptional regulator